MKTSDVETQFTVIPNIHFKLNLLAYYNKYLIFQYLFKIR